MIKQLFAQATLGFSLRDIPFLLLQIALSAIFAWIIRHFWKKDKLSDDERYFLDFLLPVQIVFTVIAVFSIQTPWMMMIFGFLSLIPLLGKADFSLRSKAYYLCCLFVAFGCGAGNLVVSILVTVVFILPLIYFNRPKS